MKGKKLPEVFAAGEIDAFSMREPYISQARELVGAENVVIFAKPGLYLKSFNLVATNDLIRTKPQVIEKALRALIKAESFASSQKGQAISIMSQRLKIEEAALGSIWPEIDLRVALGQALLVGLEDEAQWAIANELVEFKEAPNYLDFIHLDALKAVKSNAMSIIH
jgi:NitT/TauT family transport system substrate-binding protein